MFDLPPLPPPLPPRDSAALKEASCIPRGKSLLQNPTLLQGMHPILTLLLHCASEKETSGPFFSIPPFRGHLFLHEYATEMYLRISIVCWSVELKGLEIFETARQLFGCGFFIY